MKIYITQQENSSIKDLNLDSTVLLYYQSKSSKGPQFLVVTTYSDYILNYEEDEKARKLLSLGYALYVHRISNIDVSSVYVGMNGEAFMLSSFVPTYSSYISFKDTTLPNDYFIMFDYLNASYNSTAEAATKNWFSPYQYVFRMPGAKINKESLDSGMSKFYTFPEDSANITTSELIEKIYQVLHEDNRLEEEIDWNNKILGIHLIDNVGVVSNYNDYHTITTDNFTSDKNRGYQFYLENKTNQDLGVTISKPYNQYIITVNKYADDGKTILVHNVVTCSDLSEINSDYLTITLGDGINETCLNTEYRLNRSKSFCSDNLYLDKLAELEEVKDIFDIALDPGCINGSQWATTLLLYVPSATILTTKYYDDPNIAAFYPASVTVINQEEEKIYPSYYLFLAMYPDKYLETVNEYRIEGSNDEVRSGYVTIVKTDYGYEISNPSVASTLNKQITVSKFVRMIRNHVQFTSMSSAKSYVESLGATVMSNDGNKIHVKLLIDDTKVDLNINVTIS